MIIIFEMMIAVTSFDYIACPVPSLSKQFLAVGFGVLRPE